VVAVRIGAGATDDGPADGLADAGTGAGPEDGEDDDGVGEVDGEDREDGDEADGEQAVRARAPTRAREARVRGSGERFMTGPSGSEFVLEPTVGHVAGRRKPPQGEESPT
jgi:hypothetical protein